MSAAAADNNSNNNGNICANCGKGEESTNSLKACTACKMVKYCNRECQIAHRPQHKKECKKRAAELHDERLFKQPELVDCPICMLRMPFLISGRRYYGCCGKVICCGCACAPVYDDKGNVITEKACPFCRTLAPSSDAEEIEMTERRVAAGDPVEIFNLGCWYKDGLYGFSPDISKALELWHKAADLGHAQAYYNVGIAYDNGRGVKMDEKKARYYFELAAMGGHAGARYNLGAYEENAGNVDRAVKHYMISVRDGDSVTLETIRKMITIGHATKDDYAKALGSYQVYLDEIKSDQRDKAAAADVNYKYY